MGLLEQKAQDSGVMHKMASVVLGKLSLFAGMIALVGYALPALNELMPLPAGVIVYNPVSLPERLIGAALIWCLTLAAFYMGFRLLRFLFLHRKH